MNDLHIQNPPFRQLITEIERATDAGEIRVSLNLPIRNEVRNANENFRLNLVTKNNIFHENMVWNAMPFPESLTSLNSLNNFFKNNFFDKSCLKGWKIYIYE
jgi:hypothetical protein